MLNFLLGAKGEERPSSPAPAILLVICPDDKINFAELYSGITLDSGRQVRVVQTKWNEFLVQSDSSSGKVKCYVHVNGKSPSKGTHQPDLVLIRSEVRGVTQEQDYRNLLFGLMYAGIPAVNSLESVYSFLERPVVFGELVKLRSRHGQEAFPIVQQSYFASHREMMYGDSYPAVMKLGHAHAGYGKMKVGDHHMMEDVRSVLALTTTYATVEPFIEGSYDLRIQKIGSHFRAFKRISVSGSWKTNTGSSHVEEIEVTPRYRFWIEEASKMFGGLDICTVDAIHDASSGEELIMEVNGTSSGFCPLTDAEDNDHLKEVVVQKFNSLQI